jgi:hypothetical protein
MGRYVDKAAYGDKAKLLTMHVYHIGSNNKYAWQSFGTIMYTYNYANIETNKSLNGYWQTNYSLRPNLNDTVDYFTHTNVQL